MDPQAEQRVLATLYDRLFDAISYNPQGGSTIDRSNTRLMMAKNFVLDPADFANAASPLNPGPNADYTKAKAFSDLADPLPDLSAVEWISAPNPLSGTYPTIVNGANATSKPDPEQQKKYNAAYGYLNVTTKIQNYDGSFTESVGPSPIAQTYNDNQSAYINAVGGFRIAQNGYDLSNPADQRAFNAVAPGLQNTVDQAWNKWNREGKANVEQAQNAMASSINDAVSAAITQAQQLVSPGHMQAALPGGNPWLLSYGQPVNWMDPKLKGSMLTLRSSYLNKDASSEATSYSAGGGFSYGLWSASGNYGHGDETQNFHMDASDFELNAELVQVRIMRPWYNPLLFTMNGWNVKGYGRNDISNKAMPWVATTFVFARNVTIKSNFTSQDQSHFASHDTATTSVGWGPFSVSGSYSHSQSKDKFQSKLDAGTLSLPGLQVIAFVCSRTPPSPPA